MCQNSPEPSQLLLNQRKIGPEKLAEHPQLGQIWSKFDSPKPTVALRMVVKIVQNVKFDYKSYPHLIWTENDNFYKIKLSQKWLFLEGQY